MMQRECRSVAGLVFGILLAFLISNTQADDSKNKFKIVKSWKALEFAYESPKARESAIQRGEFNPGKPLPVDLDVYQKSGSEPRIFITIPRFQSGIPATLGYVTNDVSPEGNPIIAPFPSWDWHRSGDCDKLTSVWRIEIDPCGRLWVMDAGKVEETQVCPPQLLSFSLDNNQLLSRYKIPKEHYTENSLFTMSVADVRDNKCDDAFVYIADARESALVVYDHKNTRSWKTNSRFFGANRPYYPYPDPGSYGLFGLMNGLLGMAINDDRRTLFFHSLASRTGSHIPTSILRNHTLFQGNPDASPRFSTAFPNERNSQSAAEVMDDNGVLFFGLSDDSAIGCWNSRKHDHNEESIEKVAVNPETMQFVSGIKVITTKDGRQELWVMTLPSQQLATEKLDTNKTNFRIQTTAVDELIRGTKCDVTGPNTKSG